MYGNILNQRINYFEISPYKDYSKLEEKNFLTRLNKSPWEVSGVDEFTLFDKLNSITGNPGKTHQLRPKKECKRNSDYFYSGTDNYEDIRLYPYFKKNNSFVTTKQRHLKNHYANPLSEFSTHIFERNITLTDDKLSIRVCRYSKHRQLNGKFFKKHSIVYGVNINLKTGNFITYFRSGHKRKATSKIRQNSFGHLTEVMDSMLRMECGKNFAKNFDEIKTIYDVDLCPKVFLDTIYHTLSSLLEPKDQIAESMMESNPLDTSCRLILNLFVKNKGLKLPNGGCETYMFNWYPTKKYLVKNDNKLIAAILDRLGIKSKSLIKLLHKVPNTNLYNLGAMVKLFGSIDVHKFLPNIDSRYFSTSQYMEHIGPFTNGYEYVNRMKTYYLRPIEKTRLLKLLNSFFDKFGDGVATPKLMSDQLNQINDHLSMLEKIQVYLPDTEFKSTNFSDFHHEHLEYAKIQRSIKKGYSIKYTFEQRLIDAVEKPIEPIINIGSMEAPIHCTDMDGVEVYYPVILKTDSEYSEEGQHMHHCVATYADREQSLIVSIRENNPIGSERVTCEFDTRTKKLVQAKYFCNAVPPERFKNIIEKLEHKLWFYSGSIKSTGKEKIPLIINGVEILLPERSEVEELIFLANNMGF